MVSVVRARSGRASNQLRLHGTAILGEPALVECRAMEGRRLGRYLIQSKLAEGGMGAVYLATHELMGREVVIKLLLPQFSMERDIIDRFFNEARVMGNLNHPGIVAIFDLDYAEDGRAYIVMERLQGESLHQRLRRVQRMSLEQTVDLARQLASALAAAHGKGVVHRDLKPANVFLSEDLEVPGRERVKVLDFGVAKLALQQSALVTRVGAVVGTPTYMAPEQCRDASTVDHRADLYALGCIMYACLCGRPPFTGESAEVLAAQLRDTPARPRTLDPSLPPWLDELVMRLLEKDPGRRLQSCAQVIEVLDHGMRHAWHGGLSGVGMVAAPQTYAGSGPIGRDATMPPMATQGPGSTFARAAAEVHSHGGSRRRLWMSIAGAALGVLGFGLYLGLTSPHEEAAVLEAHEVQPAAVAENAHAGEAAGAQGDDQQGDGAEEQAGADAEAAIEALLGEAWVALDGRDWAVAGSKAQEVLQREPEHAAARDIVTKAEQEQANALLYRKLEQALKMRDFDEAAERLAALPESSLYRELGRAKLARARGTYEADMHRVKAQAEAWRDAGKCSDIRALQAAWVEIESELEAMVEHCEQTRKQQAAKAEKDKAAAAAAAAAAHRPAPAPARNRFDELLAQSQDAVKQGSYTKAHRLCREALELRPSEPRAVDVCAVAACNLRNAAQARGYYAIASDDRKVMIHRFCLGKGIVLAR
jgi:tRNA A-37 threonylcarbamoyl transferase component Bud32